MVNGSTSICEPVNRSSSDSVMVVANTIFDPTRRCHDSTLVSPTFRELSIPQLILYPHIHTFSRLGPLSCQGQSMPQYFNLSKIPTSTISSSVLLLQNQSGDPPTSWVMEDCILRTDCAFQHQTREILLRLHRCEESFWKKKDTFDYCKGRLLARP